MEAKGLTPILNVSDIASTVVWFEKWGWKKLWDWGAPPTFGAVGSGKEACIFLCRGRREAADAAQTAPLFSGTETKRATRASGCRSEWTTWTGCTSTASPPGWRSHFRLPICHGTFARCTFDIPMATCSGSAADSSPKNRTKVPMSEQGFSASCGAENQRFYNRVRIPKRTKLAAAFVDVPLAVRERRGAPTSQDCDSPPYDLDVTLTLSTPFMA